MTGTAKPIDLRATLGQFLAEMDAVGAPEVDAAMDLLRRSEADATWRHDALQVVGAWIRRRNDPQYGYFQRLGLRAGCNCGGL